MKTEVKLHQRYYSAFQVMEAVNQVCPEEWLKIAERLGKAETNDAVPVVRCKDCKHSEHWIGAKWICSLWSDNGISVFCDGFCNYGERRDDDGKTV